MLKTILRSCATILALSIVSTASAQDRAVVTGTVTDEAGEPLIGATVLIEGTTDGDAVDIDGTYRIQTTREGDVVILASYVGFATARRNVTLTVGQTTTEDFALASDALGLEEIFVTGVVNPVSKIESSVSITTLEPESIELVVPRTTAEVFRAIPGIRAEASAGDGNTNITVRGVPISAGGSKYLQLQEDGLPVLLFGDIAFATADIFVRADPTVARLEAIRGGSASTKASNSPAGIVNFISRTGQVAGGQISTTAGLDYNFQRTDFAYGSPVGDGLSFHIGGFLRTGEGERNAGYLAQQGGQIKANLTKYLDNGYVRINAKHLNDRTPAYMPQPIRVTGSNDSPSFEDAGGLGVNDGGLHSNRLLTNFGLGSEGERRRSSLADGLHPVSSSLGFELSLDLGDGFTVENRGRFSLNSGRFVAPFTAVTGSSADVLASLSGATGRDLAGATLSRAHDGSAFSGDVLQGIVLFDTELKNFNNVFNDANLTKSFEQDDLDLTITAGLFTAVQRVNMAWLWNSYLMEVEGDNAALIDVTAADGTMLSSNGLVGYGATFFGNCCAVEYDATYDVKAPYLAASFAPTPELSLDASVRYDVANVSGVGSGGIVAPVDVNQDGEIAAVEEGVNLIDHSQKNPVDYDYSYLSFSAGANYKLTDASAMFGRFSRGHSAKADRAIFPTGAYVGSESLGIENPYDLLDQAELGYKHQFDNAGLFVTGFFARTKEQGGFEASTQEFIDNDYQAFGVEVEGVAQFGPIDLRGAATYTKAEVTSGGNEGNTPRRQPDLLFSLIPSYSAEDYTVGISLVGQTDAYAQDSNELVLPGFAVLNAFASVNLTNSLSLGLSANNILDTIGITESEEGAIPNSGYIRARSISGRTIAASIRYGF